jgi:Holliday junction resolvase RusA-like endonuclease
MEGVKYIDRTTKTRRRDVGYVLPKKLNQFSAIKGFQGDTIYATIPLPPSLNDMYVPNGRGGVRLTKLGREYKEAVHFLLMGAPSASQGPLSVHGTFYMPDEGVRDLDNLLKAAIDVLKDVLRFKDENVTEILVRKRLNPERPRAVLEVSPGIGIRG